jgi:hypothetical protein
MRFVVAAALGLLTPVVCCAVATGIPVLLYGPPEDASEAAGLGAFGMFGLAFGSGLGLYVFAFVLARLSPPSLRDAAKKQNRPVSNPATRGQNRPVH